jgi:hypothetical protein
MCTRRKEPAGNIFLERRVIYDFLRIISFTVYEVFTLFPVSLSFVSCLLYAFYRNPWKKGRLNRASYVVNVKEKVDNTDCRRERNTV